MSKAPLYDEENPPIAVTISPIQPGQQGYEPPVTAIPVGGNNGSVYAVRNIVLVDNITENIMRAISFARSVRFLSIVDGVCICILSFFYLFWLVFLVGPICGYLGATRFDKNYTNAYIVYWGFRLVFDALAVVYGSWLYLVSVALDIIIIRYVVMYVSSLKELSPQELTFIQDAARETSDS
jgi:hypothetical protein